jgi:small subunit ribosomal protein S18
MNTKLEMAFGERNGAGGFGGKSGGGGRGGGREDRGERGDRGSDMERGGGRGFGRRKVCRYCADKKRKVCYKNA